ncbi:hypothetical protein Q2K19_31720 [Micromonospora soli]|uniref:hypothetical protein n=1 Tax=Micromonospora sp. NBRC 110009 TaxID=3061627 RepID=UPI002670DA7B|nr:hypothetical protein [Micromonospora sp. NBRC 110009]WKT98661.1 hypothetical protein Q2K19_31720 [Micromonospora sp. NBRC 110009]
MRARLERAVGAAMKGEETMQEVLQAIEDRLVEAGQAYAKREISLVTLTAIEAETKREQKAVRERIAQAQRLQALPAMTPEGLAEWWVDALLERRRELLALVLDRIIVKPATRAGQVQLDVDRLEFVWK